MGRIEFTAPELQFKFAPGEDFKWRELLIDPARKELFRWRSNNKELGRDGGEEIDERLERLNDRMEELHEMIDQLIEQARQGER